MGIEGWATGGAATAATITALLASGAPGAAAAAPAPSLSAGRACYVNTASVAPVTITGAGWTPGDTVQLASRDGRLYGTATVDPAGEFQATLQGAAVVGRTEQTETLTASDQGNQTSGTPANGQTASVSFLVTNLLATTNPSQAGLRQKVRFTFSGFRPGAFIYAHYLHRGRQLARQRFGRAAGPCGILRTRALQYPGGNPRYSSYLVQVDDSARYSRRSTPRYVARLSTF